MKTTCVCCGQPAKQRSIRINYPTWPITWGKIINLDICDRCFEDDSPKKCNEISTIGMSVWTKYNEEKRIKDKTCLA